MKKFSVLISGIFLASGFFFCPDAIAQTTMKVLVVGGGGGNGAAILSSSYASGGGGGQVTYNSSYSITSGTPYTVAIGAGGTGTETSGVAGGNGSSSVFGTITASGGIGAILYNNGTYYGIGGTSGSGVYTGGYAIHNTGGGGAGNSQNGTNGVSNNVGGPGGNGTANSISGSAVYYGGGGGGGGGTTQATGGLGGGGTASNGGTNTGGGGGGNSSYNGGSGIVIISWVTANFSAYTISVTGTGNAITKSGANSIATFITSGTFTVHHNAIFFGVDY